MGRIHDRRRTASPKDQSPGSPEPIQSPSTVVPVEQAHASPTSNEEVHAIVASLIQYLIEVGANEPPPNTDGESSNV